MIIFRAGLASSYSTAVAKIDAKLKKRSLKVCKFDAQSRVWWTNFRLSVEYQTA